MGISFGFGSADCRMSASISGISQAGLTVGIWINMEAIGTVNRCFWSASDTATATNYVLLRHGTTERVQIAMSSTAAGEDATAIVSTALTARTWTYVLGRYSGQTWRAVHTIQNNNSNYQSASSTVSIATSGVDTVTLGALVTSGGTTENFNGRIAEYFLAEGDIFGGNITLGLEPMVRKLAYEGPLAYSGLQDHLIEYRSLRRSSIDAGSNNEDIFTGAQNNTRGVIVGATPWANFITTVNPQACEHPPLYPTYRKPTDTRRYMVV